MFPNYLQTYYGIFISRVKKLHTAPLKQLKHARLKPGLRNRTTECTV